MLTTVFVLMMAPSPTDQDVMHNSTPVTAHSTMAECQKYRRDLAEEFHEDGFHTWCFEMTDTKDFMG